MGHPCWGSLVPSLPWLPGHRDHWTELKWAFLGSPHCWAGFSTALGKAERGKALESGGIDGTGGSGQRREPGLLLRSLLAPPN